MVNANLGSHQAVVAIKLAGAGSDRRKKFLFLSYY
jgi:hypothetical protein